LKSFVFGYSTQKIPILAYEFGQGEKGKGERPVFIFGAHHGDEVEGTILSYGLLAKWIEHYDFRMRTVLLPTLNIDGQLAMRRWNARNVDLNRNLPTRDWTPKIVNPRYPPGEKAASEVETRALVDFIEEQKPVFILSLHSYHPMILENGPCQEESKILGRFTGYEVKENVGYPTPGSLGTYAGHDRNIPTITYEIERGLPGPDILKLHLPAITELMKHLEQKYGY